MAKTKQILHASLGQGNSGWYAFLPEYSEGPDQVVPLDDAGSDASEARALRELKNAAFVWGYTHLDLLNDDSETIRMIALKVTPERRERLKDVVKRSEFPTNHPEHWIRVHRLAYKIGILPLWKIRAILRHPELAKAVTA